MNKWSKLTQFITLLSTFIALGVALYLIMQKQDAFPEEKFNEVISIQQVQGEEFKTLSTDLNTKIDTQNNVILEYDKRIGEVETKQSEFLTIISEVKKNEKSTDKAEKPEETAATVEKKKTPSTLYVKSVDGLNLRKKATVDSASLGILDNNAKLKVVGGPKKAGTHTWYNVQTSKGTKGWVAVKYTKEK